MYISDMTRDRFEEEVLESQLPVLVDFWASWCTPCRMEGPVMAQIAEDYAGKLRVVKVNTESEPELSNQFKIMSIPTLMLFKNGRYVWKTSGFKSEEEVRRMLKGTIGTLS